MDYVEKVKIVRNAIENGISIGLKEILLEHFPEAAESEDERIRKELIEYLKSDRDCQPCQDISFYDDAIAYLEKQKEQKPAEWNEQDELHLNNAILAAEKEWGVESCTAKFLKSLRPQPHWKPLPEQLEALMYAIEGKWDMIKPTSYLSRMLEDLYDGLVNTYNVDENSIYIYP